MHRSLIFILFVLVAVCLLTFPHRAQARYNLANCNAQLACTAPRECTNVGDLSNENLLLCEQPSVYCACIAPLWSMSCHSDFDCSPAESCEEIPKSLDIDINISDGICVDKSQLSFLRNPIFCTSSSQCPSNSACVQIANKSVCLHKLAPSSQGDASPAAEPSNPSVSQPLASGEPDVDAGSVCIAAQALLHLAPGSLLYESHWNSSVLCDENDSCATPGHMVHWRGRAVSMRSYCAQVSCTRRRMLVNSPRYTLALRVPSNTKHLYYCSFAARYGSRYEEALLAALIWLGL